MISGFERFDERQVRLEIAARNVVSACRADRFGRGWRPKGVDEVAIVLESLGYSADVIGELWYASIFDLARDVNGLVEKYVDDTERAEFRGEAWFKLICRDYAVGALYSGPWIVAVLGLAVFGAALWSSLSTPAHLATAIALGVYGALILSGVFSQIVARRLTSYYLQGNVALMAWTTTRALGLALATFAVFGFTGWLGLRRIYHDPDAMLAAAFFVASGVFQVSLAPLYTMRKFTWIIGVSLGTTVLTGATFVFAFHRIVSLPLQPLALACEVGAIGLTVMLATCVWMHRLSARTSTMACPPSKRAILRAVLPYGAFGFFYFSSIVVDHVFAGFHDVGVFTYRAGYELGCDLALLAIIPVVGVLNIVLEELPRTILAGAALSISEIPAFDRRMTRYYLLSVLGVLAATAVAVGFVELVGQYLLTRTQLGGRSADQPEALLVMNIAAVGDGLLMLGLLGAQLLFILNRPSLAVIGAVGGTVVSALVGTGVNVMHLPVAGCAVGLDLGVLTFALISSLGALRAVRRFTYSYYAAY